MLGRWPGGCPRCPDEGGTWQHIVTHHVPGVESEQAAAQLMSIPPWDADFRGEVQRRAVKVGAVLLAAASEVPAQHRCHRCTTILDPDDEGGEFCDACAAELADEILQEWTREARSDEEVEAAPAEGGQE